MQRAVTTVTTGVAGSGKTLVRCAHFLVDEFLPNETGVHISNFPINVDKVVKAVAKKTGRPEQEVRDRIWIIPKDVDDAWRDGKSGPWEWLDDADLQGAHIALDEAHHYCGKVASIHPKEHKKEWIKFCGELRHRGATIEFLTQDVDKLASELLKEAGLRLEVVDSENRRDPFFSIPLGDWYELRAKFSGVFTAAIWEREYRKVFGRWSNSNTRVFWRDPEYFKFYDSYAAPKSGGRAGKAKKQEFEKRTLPSLLWWFVRRNAVSLLPRLALLCFVAYLVGGGGGTIIAGTQKYFKTAVAKRAASKKGGTPESKLGVSGTRIQPQALSPLELKFAELRRLRSRVREMEEEKVRGEVDQEEAQALLDQAIRQRDMLRDVADRGSTLRMVTPMMAVMEDGVAYRPGQKIRSGRYAGRELKEINYGMRHVVLSDGTILGLAPVVTGRLPGIISRQPISNAGAEVSGSLSPAREAERTKRIQSLRERAIEYRRKRNAAAGVPAVSGGRGGDISGGRSSFGSRGGDDGSSGRDGGTGTGSVGSTPRRTGDANR